MKAQMTDPIEEKIEIPVEEGKFVLKGSIYSTSHTPKKAPWILNLPGITEHRESKFVQYYTEKFADAGFYVLCYDYRGHGETAKTTGKNLIKLMPKIFSDIRAVIKWVNVTQKDRLFNNQIILFGRSLGGAIILTHGYLDEGAKLLIPLCTRYDYATYTGLQFPEVIIKHISPKYFIEARPSNNNRILLAHCKDDPQIPFDNVFQIQDQLELADENVLIFEEGGHSFKGHREEILHKSLKFIEHHFIQHEDVDIPVNGGEILLKGTIYFSKNTPQKAPWLIVATGLMGNRSSYFPNYFIEKFAKAGFYVICYDHRAHGETAKQTGKNWIKLLPNIFKDIHKVIEYITEKQALRLLDDKIYLFGRSFSGAMLLTQGYSDERAKKIVALCTRYNYRNIKARFPEESIDFMSCKNYLKKDLPSNKERILVAHCRDDPQIPFFNVEKIRDHLELPEENVITFSTGGHSFKGHRRELAQKIIEFLTK